MAVTKQEIANRIYEYYFVNMGQLGYDHTIHSCKYLTSDGGKCAVGCLLPKELNSTELGGTVGKLFDTYSAHYNKSVVEYLGEQNQSFLTTLQLWHDNFARMKNSTGCARQVWFERFIEIVTAEGIDTSQFVFKS